MAEMTMKMGGDPSKEKYLGNLNIDSAGIPAAAKWKIGDTVKVTVEIEVVGLRKPDKWEVEEMNLPKDSVQVNSKVLSIKK